MENNHNFIIQSNDQASYARKIEKVETRISWDQPAKIINRKIIGIPISKIDTPKKGIANNEAGIMPINVLNIAVNVSAVIISLNLIGAINKLVKFLLQISSRNIML